MTPELVAAVKRGGRLGGDRKRQCNKRDGLAGVIWELEWICKMSLEETGIGTILHYGYATYGTEVYWLGMALRMRLIDMLSTEPRYPFIVTH